MSTGENLNANGATLTQAMIREGFRRFPQSIEAHVNPRQWNLIVGMQTMPGYPFTAVRDPAVPAGEVWFIGAPDAQAEHEVLGRIVNSGL